MKGPIQIVNFDTIGGGSILDKGAEVNGAVGSCIQSGKHNEAVPGTVMLKRLIRAAPRSERGEPEKAGE